jgi:hypothetical protein
MAVAHWSNGRLLIYSRKFLFLSKECVAYGMMRILKFESEKQQNKRQSKTHQKSPRESCRYQQTSTTHFTWNVRRKAGPWAVSSRTFFPCQSVIKVITILAPYGDPKNGAWPNYAIKQTKGGIHPSGFGKKRLKKNCLFGKLTKTDGTWIFTSVRPSSTELFIRSTTSRFFLFCLVFLSHAAIKSRSNGFHSN